MCHFLSTVTQVSNQLISLYMQWPMVRKMTRARMIRLLKNGTYLSSLFSSHKRKYYTSWRGKMIKALLKVLYAYRLYLTKICCPGSTVIFFHREDFFCHYFPPVLLINMSVYFQKTPACEQLLNDAVEHAIVCLKWNGLWLQLVSLSILKMGT